MIWLDLAVKPHFSWPNVSVEFPFEGRKIVLSPLTETLSSAVSLLDPDGGITFEDGGMSLGRFLSRLSWSMNAGISELFYIGSNNPQQPGRLSRGTYGTSGWSAVEPWHCIYLPAAKKLEADLGLALYREGMSINSAPFSFLSFFKVLNILHGKGDAQQQWINDNLNHLWYQPAVNRLQTLAKTHDDIGEYLYVQGRCAVAHAHGKPFVNPDAYADKRRLELDLPVMKELAALFIEQELKVPSTTTFHKQFDGAASTEILIKSSSPDGRIAYIPYSPDT